MILILITIFVLFSIVAFLPTNDNDAYKLLFAFFGILLFFTAAFRGDGDFDYSGYVYMLHRNDSFTVEPTFVLFSYIINEFLDGNSIYLFIFYAILGVSFKMFAIKQLTELWFLSVVIYVSNFFVLHEMTQIRAGVASGLLLMCIKPLYERNLKVFLLLSSLAFLFHFSAIIFFPLWFLGDQPKKKWLFWAIPLSYGAYFAGINLITEIPIPGIQEKIIMYQKMRELDPNDVVQTNVFSFVFLAKVVIFYFLLYKYDLVHSHNKYFPILMKIYSLSLVAYLVFTSLPAFSSRINELFGVVDIILIPLLFYIFKPVYFSKAIVVFIGLCLLLIVLFYSKLIF